jgi:hypothetical protein
LLAAQHGRVWAENCPDGARDSPWPSPSRCTNSKPKPALRALHATSYAVEHLNRSCA